MESADVLRLSPADLTIKNGSVISGGPVITITRCPGGVRLSVADISAEIEARWIPDLAMALMRVALDPTFLPEDG